MGDNTINWWVVYMVFVVGTAYGVISYTLLGLLGLDDTVRKVMSAVITISLTLYIVRVYGKKNTLRDKTRRRY